FAMITLALAQMIYFFYLQAPFTGGEDGIQAVPRGKLFGLIDLSNVWAMYATVLAIFVGGFLLIYRTIHSPFGQVLKALRENEARATALGYHTDRYKLAAYVISPTPAGLAGVTHAPLSQLAALHNVHLGMSREDVLMSSVTASSAVPLASRPSASGNPMKIATAATAGMVRPMLASAEPSARFRLVCMRLRNAARTAAVVSGSSTSSAITMPTTAGG